MRERFYAHSVHRAGLQVVKLVSEEPAVSTFSVTKISQSP